MAAELNAVPQCGDGTKAERKVVGVGVGVAASLQSEIDRGTCEHAVVEVVFQPGVVPEKPTQVVMVVGVQPGVPEREGT